MSRATVKVICSAVVFLLFGGLLSTTPAFGQLGLNRTSREELEKIPVWEPPTRNGVGDARRVILQDMLPPVGDQGKQNSCAAWAVAYGARTQLEIRDHGGRAERPDRQFSPAFIYNQINRGVDKGAAIPRALEFLQTHGCALWTSMPYDPKDYTVQPSEQATREATAYRIGGFQRVRNPNDIRAALQQHLVVMVAVDDEVNFRTLKADMYTTAIRQEGLERETVPRKERGHALCIVGYDDELGAFLFLNSWGTRWAQRGYCWVSYELVRQIADEPDTLVLEAFVMKSGYAPPSAGLAIQANAWDQGFQDGRTSWAWKASLSGAEQSLTNVRAVDWLISGVGSESRRFRSADAENRFGIAGQLDRPGKYTMSAVVHFGDNVADKTLAAVFQIEPPQPRNLRLAQSDRYWGTQDRRKIFKWMVRLEGSFADLAEVDQVTYHLHSSFPDPERVIKQSLANGFALTASGWGTFTVKATVQFRDGQTLDLQIPLQFHDQPREKLVLTNTARPRDESHWDWTAYLDGPTARLEQVKAVRYFLHKETFDPSEITVTNNADSGFPLSMSGWGRFELKARIYYKDGGTEDLRHMLQFADAPKEP